MAASEGGDDQVLFVFPESLLAVKRSFSLYSGEKADGLIDISIISIWDCVWIVENYKQGADD